MNREVGAVTIKFQPILPHKLEEKLTSNQVEVTEKSDNYEKKEESSVPTFWPHPDASKDYDFEDEVLWLALKFNIGDAPLLENQQDWLLNIIYDHKKVFYSVMKI